MSGSNIGDGLVTVLTNASAFDSTNVSKDDYSILEKTAACALVVQPSGLVNRGHAYGRSWAITWTIRIDGFVRDIGDPLQTLRNLWKLPDEVLAAVNADQSLNSSACQAMIVSGTRPKDILVNVGGQIWLPFDFIVEALEVM